MTVDELRRLLDQGATHINFPIRRDGRTGVELPPEGEEMALIQGGFIWFENADGWKRTYWIMRGRLAEALEPSGAV